MKRSDLYFVLCIIVAAVPFFVSEVPGEIYNQLNGSHPYVLAFIKFGILATIGEMLGLRIKSGVYSYSEFGAVPRAIVWGLYGVWIAIAMKTFAIGAPAMVETLGADGVREAMGGGFSYEKLLGAFSISVMMNTVFAPVFMTLHKITDAHIVENGGKLSSLLKPLDMSRHIAALDWHTQWNFVIKKTIPLFWIPAHTITFMLPPAYQVLFAAALSIVLGVLLSLAVVISRNRAKK